MTRRHRLSPDDRRTVIITAARRLADQVGAAALTHGDVAARCTIQTSVKTVKHYFPTRADLARSVTEPKEPK